MKHLKNPGTRSTRAPKLALLSALLTSAYVFDAQAQQVIGGQSFSSTACATESKTCDFKDTRTVAYGAAGKFTVKQLKGPVACDNTTFGDPAVGLGKACYLGATVVAPVTVSAALICGPLWSTMSFSEATRTRKVADASR